MVTSANDNATYHLTELENFDASCREMNKAFLKRQEGDPDPDIEDGSADEGEGSDDDQNDEGSREDK